MSQLFVDTIRNRDGNGAPEFDKGVVITGIVTASSISIGVTEVVSSGFQLTNILGLDATTTATIESAVAAAPNDFTSLNVSGISTFSSDIDLNADIDIFGHTEINTLNASGILTATTLATGAEGSAIRISSNTISGPATLTIDPAGIGTNTGTVVIQGDLQVEGDTTTVNSTTLTVDDKNIILASGSLTDASSDGGGITLESGEGNKTINWVDSTDSWTFSENIDLASSKTFKINGVDILSATTLGSSVVNSSLTSVGTLTSLNVSGDLDVDGHTNLDNVNVSGAITATTFTGSLSGNADTATTVTAGSQANITSLGTLTALNVSGDIDVDGHTNLDNVSISGVVTATGGFSGDIYINESTDDNVDYNIMMLQETGGGNAYRPIMVDDSGITFNPEKNTLKLSNGFEASGVSGYIDAVNINLTGIATANTFSGSASNLTGLTGATAGTYGASNRSSIITVDSGGRITSITETNITGGGGGAAISDIIEDNTPQLGGDLDLNGNNIDGTGNIDITGNATFSGDLDVDGHTNLDNVSIAGVATVGLTTTLETGILTHDLNVSGVSTFNGDIRIERDGAGIYFGESLDFGITHDGNRTIMFERGAPGNLYIGASDEVIIADASGSGPGFSYITETKARFVTNGPVRLYYDNVEKFATAGSGATVYGTFTADTLDVSGVSTFQSHVHLGDDDELRFGDSNDLKIFHNGSHSVIRDEGTGILFLQGDTEVRITDVGGNEIYGQFNKNGSVDLYYDNSKKFATAGSGATVYGTFTADTLSVSGVSTFTGDIDVDGHTNLDNVSISGIVTATQGVVDGAGNLRTLPQVSKSTAYVLIASDTGKHISITTGGVTVPSGVFSAGDVVTIFNNSSSSQTITQGASVTLRQAATTNTGSRTLAEYGVATVMCVAANTFVISGAGLS